MKPAPRPKPRSGNTSKSFTTANGATHALAIWPLPCSHRTSATHRRLLESGVSTIARTAHFDPKESFNLTLEIDATDDLEDNNPVAKRVGVADRLAALKKLMLPTEGLIGDLVSSVRALVGKA